VAATRKGDFIAAILSVDVWLAQSQAVSSGAKKRVSDSWLPGRDRCRAGIALADRMVKVYYGRQASQHDIRNAPIVNAP